MSTVIKDLDTLKKISWGKVATLHTMTPGGLIGVDIIIKYYPEENKFNIKFLSDGREYLKLTPKEMSEQTQIKSLIETQRLYAY